VTLTPSSWQFGTDPVAGSSSPEIFWLTNHGGPLEVFSWSIGPDYQIVATDCPSRSAVLAAGQSCYFKVIFRPQVVGSRDQRLRVFDRATNSPQKAELDGTGVRR
jgi:hypothetical protein